MDHSDRLRHTGFHLYHYMVNNDKDHPSVRT